MPSHQSRESGICDVICLLSIQNAKKRKTHIPPSFSPLSSQLSHISHLQCLARIRDTADVGSVSLGILTLFCSACTSFNVERLPNKEKMFKIRMSNDIPTLLPHDSLRKISDFVIFDIENCELRPIQRRRDFLNLVV